MLPLLSIDVAILGGGPAGAAAALSVRRHSDLSVVIVDKDSRSGRKIGETLQPIAREVLERLGVWQAFLAASHRPSHGTCSAWGQSKLAHSDFLFRLHGAGWHLDRGRFDEMLLAQAQANGAILMRPATVGHTERTQDGWRLEIHQSGDPKRELHAKYVIDATGQRAGFARQQGAQKVLIDQLVGLYAFFALDDKAPLRDSFTMVETVEDGWWYSAVLPQQQLVVVYMTDADEARTSRLRSQRRWRERARATTHTNRRLEGARMIAKPRVALAASHLLHPVAGEGWLAVGDAASSFDPLSSQGIVKALRTGLQAAGVVQTGQIETYQQQVTTEFERYLETKERYYRMETRWPDRGFWKRRHGNITLHPSQPLHCAALEQLPKLRMHMPVGDLEVLARLCGQQGRKAHELVAAFRSNVATDYSDSRIILTVQYLVKTGVLKHREEGSSR